MISEFQHKNKTVIIVQFISNAKQVQTSFSSAFLKFHYGNWLCLATLNKFPQSLPLSRLINISTLMMIKPVQVLKDSRWQVNEIMIYWGWYSIMEYCLVWCICDELCTDFRNSPFHFNFCIVSAVKYSWFFYIVSMPEQLELWNQFDCNPMISTVISYVLLYIHHTVFNS